MSTSITTRVEWFEFTCICSINHCLKKNTLPVGYKIDPINQYFHPAFTVLQKKLRLTSSI